MKEFLSQRNISFTEKDVSRDTAALADLERLGYLTTPVTVVDGTAVVGFDRAKLEELLGAS